MPKVPYSQQKEARQQNTSLLLRDLWRHAPLSKARLAQRNGLTKATVSAICNDLIALGLLREAGQDYTGRGRPGTLLELNPLVRLTIGIEISTNYSSVVLTNLCGEPLWRISALTPGGSSQEAVLTQAEALIAEAVHRARERSIPLLGIGVAVPGFVDTGLQMVTSSALGWKGVPLQEMWTGRFALPVVVENKARAAAMVEALSGSARGVDDFLFVVLGTDVGSSVQAALISDGQPYRGVHGLAVDAEHMILEPAGPLCVCGQRGCWRALTDVAREVELACARLAAGEASSLQRLSAGDGLDHRAIHQAAMDGDPLAWEVVREVNGNHVLGVTNLIRLFDPELVVLATASAALSGEYHNRMRALSARLDLPGAVRQHLALRGVRAPAIVDAAHGPEGCMLGAAALLVDEFLRMPPGLSVDNRES